MELAGLEPATSWVRSIGRGSWAVNGGSRPPRKRGQTERRERRRCAPASCADVRDLYVRPRSRPENDCGAPSRSERRAITELSREERSIMGKYLLVCQAPACGVEFVPAHPRQRFCSAACRQAAYRERRCETPQEPPGGACYAPDGSLPVPPGVTDLCARDGCGRERWHQGLCHVHFWADYRERHPDRCQPSAGESVPRRRRERVGAAVRPVLRTARPVGRPAPRYAPAVAA